MATKGRCHTNRTSISNFPTLQELDDINTMRETTVDMTQQSALREAKAQATKIEDIITKTSLIVEKTKQCRKTATINNVYRTFMLTDMLYDTLCNYA